MKNLLKNWNFLRMMRLILGLFILGQGIQSHEWMFILLGVLFTFIPVLNIGCCAGKVCSIRANGNQAVKSEDTIYEEIK